MYGWFLPIVLLYPAFGKLPILNGPNSGGSSEYFGLIGKDLSAPKVFLAGSNVPCWYTDVVYG